MLLTAYVERSPMDYVISALPYLFVLAILVAIVVVLFILITKKRCNNNSESNIAMFCPQCNAPLATGSKFCTNCGAKVDNN